jgi:hypothetical protein
MWQMVMPDVSKAAMQIAFVALGHVDNSGVFGLCQNSARDQENSGPAAAAGSGGGSSLAHDWPTGERVNG